MSTVPAPADSAAETAPTADNVERPEPQETPQQHDQSLVQRVSSPVFIAVYAALVIALVVMVVMLAGRDGHSTLTEAATPEPYQAWNPPPRDGQKVLDSVRPELITNVQTGATRTGLMMRGTLTEQAVSNTQEFSGHISRLLNQNCIDSVTLTTPDNMRITFWGFCFKTLPETTINSLTSFALKQGADQVTFENHNRAKGVDAMVNWLTVSESERADQIVELWEDVEASRLAADFHKLTLIAYTKDQVMVQDMEDGEDTTFKTWPTGGALQQQWGR